MKKLLSGVLTAAMAFSLVACSSTDNGGSTGSFTPGTYEGTAAGRNGDVTVSVTLTENEISEVTVTAHEETAGIADPAIEQIPAAIVAAQSTQVETVSGATITSQAIIDAANAALESAGVDPSTLTPGEVEAGEVAFTAGTYTGTAQGYNGPVSLSVTFDETSITDIQLGEHSETDHVGTPAFDIMIPEIIEANGTGIDSVSGATFTSAAIKAAVEDAATQAGCDVNALRGNTITHQAGEEITGTWDVVIVGAGGAGMSVAIAAAKEGVDVVVIEKAAFVGGNTSRSTGGMNAAKTMYQDENEFTENAGVEATLANSRENYPELNELTDTVEAQYNEYLAYPQGYFDTVELFMLDTKSRTFSRVSAGA